MSRQRDAISCLRCGTEWPDSERTCPGCGWDGEDVSWLLPSVAPEFMKPLREGETEHHITLARRRQ
jgi:hypothetical protein